MSVNRVSIKLGDTDEMFINIPLDLTHQVVDNFESISSTFIDDEIAKEVGSIEDFEVAKYYPQVTGLTGNNIAEVIRYKCVLYDESSSQYFSNPTTYGQIGFDYDDIFLRKNRFVKSFLRLDFFNSDQPTENNRLFSITLNPNVYESDILPDSTIIQPSSKEIVFELKNPTRSNISQGQGYFLYHKKSSVNLNTTKDLYMRPVFYNAKTGIIKNLSTQPGPQSIDDVIDTLYTKFTLVKNANKYLYIIDNAYSTNITQSNGSFGSQVSYDITLFETKVI